MKENEIEIDDYTPCVLYLSPEAFEKFLEVIENPPEPTPELIRIAQMRRRWK